MMLETEDVDALVQIGGLIRFSLPTNGGFQKNPSEQAEKLAKLYAPERLAQRFRYFEAFCLPTLKNQTDPNFTVGILIGTDMPAADRARLERLIEPVPQAQIIEKPIMDHRIAVEQAYDQIFDQQTPFRFSFRLDDDDALAIDYIEKVREKLPHLLMMSGGLTPEPVCMTFSKGLTLIGPPNDRKIIAANERSPMAIGLAVLGPSHLKPLVMNISHMKIHMKMLTLINPLPIMTLRTLHTSNDSAGILLPSMKFDLSDEELRLVLLDRFKLDLETVLAV